MNVPVYLWEPPVPGEYTRVPVTSPLRHEDHKSCWDDETELLQPAYAHIITDTPPHPTPTSESSPSSHSIVEVTPA